MKKQEDRNHQKGSSAWKSRKVAIVGAGAVGATFAYAMAQNGAADEICLIDLNNELCKGQVLDLSHGLPFYPTINIYAGSEKDYADADVIVITAGAAQKKGETRLDLLKKNSAIIEGIVDQITAQDSKATIVVVTNPVDILTKIALERSGWDRSRVIGSGTVLDSSRFKYLLSEFFNVYVGSIHAYILGEHGDSEFAAWSMANISGVQLDEYSKQLGIDNWPEKKKEIELEVRDSAYHIIDYKGATNFGVGLALVQIVGAILKNQRRVLTVSYHLEGEYGISDICLATPCLISQNGVASIIGTELTKEEQEKLVNSANILKREYSELKR
ncbi:L-lactate dehydrogenase [Rhodohalobacter barkolensis]|uniref:L-lactate dehydrogenase n=1 Tax=Rhodohalobacter barkolensis TaxID=2053187 RepID=A0A2N0VLU1_9BACT|nr:L-lactate dehydrogenase [Rhodohalobacter barkolensis]PKD45152.1 L-lactate dehydrogenase [Rhodohalobacter barkolensis]